MEIRSSKIEVRNKAEGRTPKLEKPGWSSECNSSFWTWGDVSSSEPMTLRDSPPANKPPPQDLEERSALFGEAIIRFAKKIPQNPVNNRLIGQLVGAGTSIGANYCEPKDSISRKEFKQRICTSRKESKETMFFLRMLATAEEGLAAEARALWREARELNIIFGAIWRK